MAAGGGRHDGPAGQPRLAVVHAAVVEVVELVAVDRVQGHDNRCFRSATWAELKAAAIAGAAVAGAAHRADVADGVGIHRYRAGLRQGPAVQNGCGSIERDARQRENIPFERSRGTKRGGTADLPEDAVIGATVGTGIDHHHRRGACGRERAPNLENPVRIVEAFGVERECSRQLGLRVELIDARRERESTQIVARQVGGDRHGCQTVVSGGIISLRLLRDGVCGVYRSRDRDAPLARDRTTRVHT